MATNKPSYAMKSGTVKNKSAAAVQVTSEQLLHEAHARRETATVRPTQHITSQEELDDYRLMKRKHFEDRLRVQGRSSKAYLYYAAWEEEQRDFVRARSIFERALQDEPHNTLFYVRYAEMEMRHKNINSARNIWDRAVGVMPRYTQFWFKYAFMEEMIGDFAAARQVFERWMEWQPEEGAWNAYIKFELRHDEPERARQIYERYVTVHATVPVWLRYARFCERRGAPADARAVYERAIEYLGDDANDERLYIAFAKFEERQRELERARAIYKYALDHLPKHVAEQLFEAFAAFEKTHGDRDGIEEVIISQRRFEYEQLVKENPDDYDAWFDYVRLEEQHGDTERVRDLYERAVAQVPPVNEKRFWRRYIYLWIGYALFEELQAEDVERARQVYAAAVKVVPHAHFSFNKLWLLRAKFELRHGSVTAARKVLGHGLGVVPNKESLYRQYIELEMQLGEISRCRTLYEKWLERAPENCEAWCRFAELECQLREVERARAIFELAIVQPLLDMPEKLWKRYIDFEVEEGEYDRARALYERLLERTKHVKVWISFAQLEWSLGEAERARAIFNKAYDELKGDDTKDERHLLTEKWKEFEAEVGSEEHQAALKEKLARKVKKRRRVVLPDGTEGGWEEYVDFVFPDQIQSQPGIKLLDAARKWKLAQKKREEEAAAAAAAADDDSAGGDSAAASASGGDNDEEEAASTTAMDTS